MPLVACPGCDRSIRLSREDMALSSVTCSLCATAFSPKQARQRLPRPHAEEGEGPSLLSGLNIAGIVLLGLGGCLLLLAFLLDTTVPAGYGESVHNIGKIANKLVLAIIGLALSLTGAVFLAAPGRPD